MNTLLQIHSNMEACDEMQENDLTAFLPVDYETQSPASFPTMNFDVNNSVHKESAIRTILNNLLMLRDGSMIILIVKDWKRIINCIDLCFDDKLSSDNMLIKISLMVTLSRLNISDLFENLINVET